MNLSQLLISQQETQELQKQEQETSTLTTDSIENYIVDGETGKYNN